MSSYQSIRPRSSMPAEDNARPSDQRGESSVSMGKSRKRKAPAHVSQNACTNCKKARAKCDGVEGQSCTRCISRAMSDTCQYELHVKTAKEELVRKIKHLEGVIDHLQGEIKEKDAWIQAMREIFSPGGRGAAILRQLQSEGDSFHSLVSALSSPPPITRNLSGGSLGVRGSDSDVSTESDDEAPSRWTSVTRDDNKIHHLMALYFAWVHPVHMFFSERHFVDSFKNHNHIYCSSALVNAICAMGCRNCVDQGGDDVAVKRLGERFTQQVWVELRLEKKMTPLSSVTYAIMFLVQLSEGQARTAFSHLRLAVESLREVDHNVWSEEAFQITFFGIHATNINWAALTYQKPPAPLARHIIVFENVELDQPGSKWQNYKAEKDASNIHIPSHAIETAKELAKLSLINLDAIVAWCGSTGKVNTKTILGLYHRYLLWKKELPRALGDTFPNLEDHDHIDLLPYTLLLHIKYCVALCQLFNPLLECRDLSKQAKVHIQNIIIRSAQAGLSVYEQFSKYFSNRYQSPLQAYYLVHLADVILRQDRLNANKVVHFCLQQLGEALPGFPVVGPLQAMFCESVLACGLLLPKDIQLLMGGRTWQSYSRDDKLGCSERLTYAQPVDLLAEAIDPSLPESFKSEWDEFIESYGEQNSTVPEERELSNASSISSMERRASDVRLMDINSLVNR